jgi:type IX secretion system PorP/SprF family membrane protein
MKKFIFFLLMTAMTPMLLRAQQDHQYTQFMYNKLLINPAYAGARGIPFITGIYRNQWTGFEGAPQSALISLNSPFLSQRVGLGVTVSNQQAGLQRDLFGQLAYSYDLIPNKDISVRIGVMGSVRSLALDFTKAQPAVPGDPSFDNQRTAELLGNVGAGIYSTFYDKFYVGLSVPRIYSNTFGFNPGAGDRSAKEYRHYYGMVGAVLPIGDGINLLPAALLKYAENAPFDADINLSLEVNQKVNFGASYRLGGEGRGESVDVLAFWQFTRQLALGAAYDFPLTALRNYSSGSFEVLLQADLKKPKRKSMSNPRFFL